MTDQPERIDVTCDSWDQFEQVFRRRLDSHQVFVPSVRPPPTGTQLEFRFSIPDGTSMSMPGRVVSTVPPPRASNGPSSAERAGMIVEFGKFARAEEKRVRALLESLEQQEGMSSLAPSAPLRAPVDALARSVSTPSRANSNRPLVTLHPSMVPRTRSSLSAQGVPTESAAVLQRLAKELAALRDADPLRVLGIDASADDAAIRRAYLTTSKRFHPHRSRATTRPSSARSRPRPTCWCSARMPSSAARARMPRTRPAQPQRARSALRVRRADRPRRCADRAAPVSDEAIRLLIAVLNDRSRRTLVARLWLNAGRRAPRRELGEDADRGRVLSRRARAAARHPEARQQLSIQPPARQSRAAALAGRGLLGRLIGKKR